MRWPAAVEAQLDAVVDQALALQPLADARPRSSRSTVPCSSTPARTRCSTYSRLRASSTTDSMPARCSRCESSSPAGPAPTMPTWVRMGECYPAAAGAGPRAKTAATLAFMVAKRRTW